MIAGLAKKEQDTRSEPEILPSLERGWRIVPAWPRSTAGVANGFRAGQSGNPAGKARGIVSPVLPAQTRNRGPVIGMSDVGDPRIPALWDRSGHPHGPAALPGLARRRSDRGADRYHGALA